MNILQIIPAEGWVAVEECIVSREHATMETASVVTPLVAWGLVERKIGTEIVGFIASESLILSCADDVKGVIGYAKADDAETIQSLKEIALQRIEAKEAGR